LDFRLHVALKWREERFRKCRKKKKVHENLAGRQSNFPPGRRQPTLARRRRHQPSPSPITHHSHLSLALDITYHHGNHCSTDGGPRSTWYRYWIVQNDVELWTIVWVIRLRTVLFWHLSSLLRHHHHHHHQHHWTGSMTPVVATKFTIPRTSTSIHRY
jgi:hypothetical protein